jgi:Uma2 family endonuclease
MTIKTPATINDLLYVPENGKAEIVNGELICMPPTGRGPSYAPMEIAFALRQYARREKRGIAFGDDNAFIVRLPNRQSFSPDAGYYVGLNSGMKFFQGAPVFAVEVRSEGDYGPAAEYQQAEKRSDYFAAGTLVVWDVNLLGADVVRVYRAAEPGNPTIYAKGDLAEAEPAVPGWTMPVDDLFEPT